MQNAAPYPETAQTQKNSTTYSTARIARVQESRTIELFTYIADCRLTDALNLLEERGFTGDTALFVLAYAQSEVQA